jgi:cytochrome b involved in lipid metabolism
MSAEKKIYTTEEVAVHNKDSDCWIIVGNEKNGGQKVYDVSKYLNDHPGGPEIILDFAGKDADAMFEDIGHSATARQQLAKLYIGDLKFDAEAAKAAATKKAEEVQSRGGLNPFAVLLLLVAIAAGYYFSQQK